MEIRQGFRSVPSRPIALAMAVLAVVALVLTAWFVLGAGGSAVNAGNDRQLINVQRTTQYCNDPFSPHDAVCPTSGDPYSPHDPS